MYSLTILDRCRQEILDVLHLVVHPYGHWSKYGVVFINDVSCFQCWLVELHEKVEVLVPFPPHVAVEELYVCSVEFFSVL